MQGKGDANGKYHKSIRFNAEGSGFLSNTPTPHLIVNIFMKSPCIVGDILTISGWVVLNISEKESEGHNSSAP